MADHLRTELVLDALNMAATQRRPEAVIHHSDQGTQYTSLAFGWTYPDLVDENVPPTRSTHQELPRRNSGSRRVGT